MLEEYDACNIYGFIVSNSKDDESTLFFKKLIDGGEETNAGIISYQIKKIGDFGAEERYFRYAAKPKDHVVELPGHNTLKSKYRLYCLRYSAKVLLLGNGGLKTTRTYQEDPFLNDCVETLKKINKEITFRLKDGRIKIVDKIISGQLEFYI